jgi:hypothetical protein
MNRYASLALSNPLAVVIGILALLLAGMLAKTKWDLHQLERAHHEATTERDSLAAEAAAERARADGWTVEFAAATGHLHRQLSLRDSSLARLAADLRASGVRITQLAAMVASLEGQISGAGVPGGPPAGDSTGVPAQWSGEVDDGALRGSWLFARLPDPRLSLDYRVEIPLEWVQGTTGDGRIIVSARSPLARVGLRFDELLVDLPPARTVNRCSWTTRGRWGVAGAGVGMMTALLLGGR